MARRLLLVGELPSRWRKLRQLLAVVDTILKSNGTCRVYVSVSFPCQGVEAALVPCWCRWWMEDVLEIRRCFIHASILDAERRDSIKRKLFNHTRNYMKIGRKKRLPIFLGRFFFSQPYSLSLEIPSTLTNFHLPSPILSF